LRLGEGEVRRNTDPVREKLTQDHAIGDERKEAAKGEGSNPWAMIRAKEYQRKKQKRRGSRNINYF